MNASSAPLVEARMPVSWSSLMTLAWPIIISRSTQTVIGLSDALLVADLGSSAVAATSAGAFNTFALLILPMGILFIISSFSSQLFGKGDLEGARRFGFYGLIISGVVQGLCMLAVLFVPPALGLLSYEPDVRGLMTVYLQARLLSGGAAMGIEALANYYGGIGNTRLPMMTSVLAMVLNVVLNWVLIKGHWGAPALGVLGSAVASSIATWIACLVLVFIFWNEQRKVPPLFMAEFRRMLRFGGPSGFNWFFEFWAFNIFINIVVAGLGTVPLAGMMSVLQLNSMSFMPAFALASAGAILVGQSIGAGDPGAVGRIVRLTLVVTTSWQGIVGLCYLVFPRQLMEPFAQGNPADAALLIDVGARMLMLSTGWQLFDATATTLAEALRAAGDTAFTLKARLILAWGVFFPGSYVTVNLLHGTDVQAMIWVVAYLALLAFALGARYRSGRWKEVQLVESVTV